MPVSGCPNPNPTLSIVMADINVLLKQEAGRIGKDIARRGLKTNLWNALIKQGQFPEELGHTLSVLTYERALPRYSAAGNGTLDTTGLFWQTITNTGLGAGAPPYGMSTDDSVNVNAQKQSEIEFRTTTETYSLKRAFVNSPRFDVEDLRIAVHRTEQIKQIMDILAENTLYAWQERYRDEYLRLCKYAVTIDGSIDYAQVNPNTGDPFVGVLAANVPTATLAQSHLDRVHTRLTLAGAGLTSYGKENGRPVYAVILSAEQSDLILTAANIRTDFRESSRVDELLKPFGIERSYRGWFHLIDDLAPRYKLNGGGTATERVDPFVRDGATGVWDTNPLYETAPYEVAIVFSPEVYTALMLKPNVAAGGMKFDPVNFKGDFRFVNILSEDKNPDGTNGYFRVILASASKPGRREFGYALFYTRTPIG